MPPSLDEHPSLARLWMVGGATVGLIVAAMTFLALWLVGVDKELAVLKTQITGDLQRMIKDDERAAAESLKAQAATEKWQTTTDANLRAYVAEKIAEVSKECAVACSKH